MRVVLAEVRGFCAGVQRAIDIVEVALQKYGSPIYVRHEIVHNRHVVDRLKAKGVRFIEDLSEVPTGSVTIFSAHGVSPAVVDEAAARGHSVIDATCPLVLRVHNDGGYYANQGREVILIGHEGHPEVEGTMGWLKGAGRLVSSVEDVDRLVVADPLRLAYVTQTTLSVDDTKLIIEALRRRFPSITGPDTKEICYATQNRQQAVAELAEIVDLVLVVGAKNSSNSNRLCEIPQARGVPTYLVEEPAALKPEWLQGVGTVGVTAGASAPEDLVQGLIEALRTHGATEVTTLPGVPEDLHFKLPPQLLS
ncbi:4-hydroxy-3-methylbut-2-enyl diphosphate reductase [Telmatospirillum sp.]|uniref:4-hydroxy-3-methylbut-2-enyl diphosphate reductase n=1 Tax=Telmatospirillum sp. TaxID=2079197 RepID=UPI002845C9DD|nr:4-hydroxy-3-methylbut-2-enyl diphosphate reductase [Telmatospirillum sp.]MDR3439297.1 4-hydroxy-3-methylbut-2-enyl diphosphate reductase [Telmatospirillum sp.]